MFCYSEPNSVMIFNDVQDIIYNVARKRENIPDYKDTITGWLVFVFQVWLTSSKIWFTKKAFIWYLIRN